MTCPSCPTHHFGSFLITTHTQKAHRFLSHSLHYATPISLPPTGGLIHDAAAAKSNPVLNTPMRLILHLCALPAWQYTLNATQPSMNQHTISSRNYRARTPAHRFLKLTTKYLLKHKMTQCSTYTTPNLPPTLAACLTVCKGIHSNKCRPIKSS